MGRSIYLVMLVGIVGCHAPMPTFNPFAPYGSTRIPAPGTGSFGTPDPYYHPPAQPSTVPNPQGQSSRQSTTDDWADHPSNGTSDEPSELNWSSPSVAGNSRDTSILAPTPTIRDGTPSPQRPRPVIRANYDESREDRSSRPPPNAYAIIEPSSPGAFPGADTVRPLRPDDLPFTDATRDANRSRDAPWETPADEVRDISSLPASPSRVRARLRGLSNDTETLAPPAYETGSSTRNASASSGGWTTR